MSTFYTFLISTVFQCEYPCIFISLVRKEITTEGRLLLKYLLISMLAVRLALKKKLALQKEMNAVWCQYCQM